MPDVYAEVSTDIVLCEQVSRGCRFDVRSQTLCGEATHPAHRELRRSFLNLHFDDQWHTVFVDCIHPPAIDGLTEAFLDDLIEKNLFSEGSDTDYLKPLLAAASGCSLLGVPRILRSNLQFVLNTVNYEHEFGVGDAPSSCSHDYTMSLVCSPTWLSRSSTFTFLRPSFSCKDMSRTGPKVESVDDLRSKR